MNLGSLELSVTEIANCRSCSLPVSEKQEDSKIIFDTRRGHIDTLATFTVLGDIVLPTPSSGGCKSFTHFSTDRFTEKKMFFKQSSGISRLRMLLLEI